MPQASQRRGAGGAGDSVRVLLASCITLCQGPHQVSLELRRLFGHRVGAALTLWEVNTLGPTSNQCSEELGGEWPWLPLFRRKCWGAACFSEASQRSNLFCGKFENTHFITLSFFLAPVSSLSLCHSCFPHSLPNMPLAPRSLSQPLFLGKPKLRQIPVDIWAFGSSHTCNFKLYSWAFQLREGKKKSLTFCSVY